MPYIFGRKEYVQLSVHEFSFAVKGTESEKNGCQLSLYHDTMDAPDGDNPAAQKAHGFSSTTKGRALSHPSHFHNISLDLGGKIGKDIVVKKVCGS
jgi:hypothetical protein